MASIVARRTANAPSPNSGMRTRSAEHLGCVWTNRPVTLQPLELELRWVMFAVAVTARRDDAAGAIARRFGITPEQVLSGPHFLVGDAVMKAHSFGFLSSSGRSR